MFSKTVFFKKSLKCVRGLRSKIYDDIRFLSASPDSKIEESIEDKVIYNSVLHRLSYTQRKMYEAQVKNAKPLEIHSNSYSLKFLSEAPEESIKEEDTEKTEDLEIQLPFSKGVLKTDVEHDESVETLNWEQENLNSNSSIPSGWMNDYEKYTPDENDEDSSFGDWGLNYGTCNESTPVSRVPCGGCGAYLHCQNFSIPGFIPYEIFKRCNDADLRALTCQRCHFLKNYNTALSISVDPESYPKLLSKIKNEMAMVLLLVDLTDFPCSIWPGILDVIGRKRPIFLIGNKVDLLWGDSKGWMNHALKVLRSSLPNANVVHTQLISAKTGFGVEELITKLHNVWAFKGDVYLVGCTNVGKSTLFNALLQSDYCKVKARDLVRRATTSPWPGTTLNLLKFPILNPQGWRLFLRTQRLMKDRLLLHAEKKLKKEQISYSKSKPKSPIQIMGHIGMTFHRNRSKEIETSNPFSVPNSGDVKISSIPESGLDPKDKDYALSRWFYDTPGVLHPAQNLDLLTTEEIVHLLPKTVIEPRTYQMKPNWTLFLGGLARIDYTKGEQFIRCTVFSSKVLPITICQTADADQIYSELVGTDKMGIPIGRGERLKSWPYLSCGQPLVFSGINEKLSCADIVLSSSGWISITPFAKEVCTILPWTPNARGIYARAPSLLPHAVNLRGKKIHKTPAYNRTKVCAVN